MRPLFSFYKVLKLHWLKNEFNLTGTQECFWYCVP